MIAARLDRVVASQPSIQPLRKASGAGGSPLTNREGEVVELIAQGMSNREIAIELVISEKTVKTHVSNILSKLHLADRTQAAIYALKAGLDQEK